MGPKKRPVAEAYSADFHAPSVVSISGAFARIQGSDTCLAGCGGTKAAAAGARGAVGWGGRDAGDAQQELIQPPQTAAPGGGPSQTASPCQRWGASGTTLYHTAGGITEERWGELGEMPHYGGNQSPQAPAK